MDKDNVTTALTRNGLTRMQGVRGEVYRYGGGDKATYFTIRTDRWYGDGPVEHLPLIMGYSEDEIRKALLDITCDRTATECVVDMLKQNRKDGGC